MPELPEVETIRKQLHERLEGAVIKAVHILRTGREEPAGEEFVRKVVGRRLEAVKRRAKLLIFQFDDGHAMVAHLKMTGRFVFMDQETDHGKHDRIRFVFNADADAGTAPPPFKGGGRGVVLMWSDVRQFGYLRFVDAIGLQQALSIYGPEPLETSVEELVQRLSIPSRRTIKAVLLDQSVIAGIGNIYADEACHRAGVLPTRKLSTLSGDEKLILVQEAVAVLRESLAQKGTSSNDYVDTDGERGGFLALLKVYGRGGQLCTTCTRSTIKKIFVAQRGTHYCEICQK